MNRTKELLDQIVETVHPTMAESIRLSAIPHWFDAHLFAAVRAQDDGRNDGIIERLQKISFVLPVPMDGTVIFRVRDEERLLLNIDWINRDPAAYLAAHQRAFDYHQIHNTASQHYRPDNVNSLFIEEYPQLYHQFFVELPNANRALILLFRTFYKERRLGAIDSLLEMLEQVHEYLHLLVANKTKSENGDDADSNEDDGGEDDGENTSENTHNDLNSGDSGATLPLPAANALLVFDTLRTHYRARSCQLRGNWQESLQQSCDLRLSPELPHKLAPYVIRSYGTALAKTGQHVDGIYQLKEAIDRFQDLPPDPTEPWQNEIEQAYTMIELGEAYVAFAQEVRGFTVRDTADSTVLEIMRDAAALLMNGPLVVYLSRFLGRRVWLPNFWPILRHLDWVIARLFARAVALYEQADGILERTDALDEHVIADEKLAFLYVVMGDAQQAHHHFQILLNTPTIPLSNYRRARITVGDAWTHVQNQAYAESIALLESVLPILATAEDDEVSTLAHSLLSESYMATEQPALAIASLGQALERMTAQNAEVPATNLLERLELLLDRAQEANKVWVDNARQQVAEASVVIRRRVYDIGFHHPLLRYFRQFVALLVPGAIVLGLLITLDLKTSLELAPELNVHVPPLLNQLEMASAQLSQGVTAAALTIGTDAGAGILFGFLFLGGFLLLSLIVGLLAIELAGLRELEKHQKKRVIIDDDSITVGPPDSDSRVQRQDISRMVRGDVCLWQQPMPEHSVVALHAKSASAILPGSTNWYGRITGRITGRLNHQTLPQVEMRDLSYSLLRGWPTLLYGINLLWLGIVLVVALFGADRALWADQLGTPYSIVDIYPYLFLGAALVPTWWAILRPLQIYLEASYVSRMPWIVLGVGTLLTFILAALFFRPIFTVPDIYPTLVIVPSMLMAAYVIWRFKIGDSFYYSQRARVAAVAVAGIVSILLIGAIQRDVRSYHYFIMGNIDRDQNESARAISNYRRAVRIGRRKAWGIFDPVEAFRPNTWPYIFGQRPGLPTQDSIPWFAAQKNLAALQSQEGTTEGVRRAVQNYNQLIAAVCWTVDEGVTVQPPRRLSSGAYRNQGMAERAIDERLECDKEHANLFAWRAIALTQAATSTQADGEISTSERRYERAIQDYEKAIELAPDNDQYHLWRGFSHQSLGQYEEAGQAYQHALELNPDDVALQRRVGNLNGWMAYEQKYYVEAIDLFATVILTATVTENGVERSRSVVDDLQRDALRGKGYASYSYGQQLYNEWNGSPPEEIKVQIQDLYEQADATWMQLEGLSEFDILKSLATLHWAKSLVIEGLESRCAEWTLAESFFQRSLLPRQPTKEKAFTYRSLAQIEWALQRCTDYGYNRIEMIERAVNSYGEAVKFGEEDERFYAYYAHMRARIGYVFWLTRSEDGQPLEHSDLLSNAMIDFQTALKVDAVDGYISEKGKSQTANQFDYTPNKFVVENVLPAALAQLQIAIENGDQAAKTQLWDALKKLIPLIRESNQILVDRYNQILQAERDGLARVEPAYKSLLEDGLALAGSGGVAANLINARSAFAQGNLAEAMTRLARIDLSAFATDEGSVQPPPELVEGIGGLPQAQPSGVVESGDDIDTYLAEGALGLSHIVRGDYALEEGRIAAALSAYVKAYAAYNPKLNLSAQQEHVDAALKAGRAALLLGRHQDARTWYANALEKADSYPDVAPQTKEKIVREIAYLEAQTFVNRTTQRTQQTILEALRAWVELRWATDN